jgi:antitoxin component YwqK of YwqJK toxin-antitoxin module
MKIKRLAGLVLLLFAISCNKTIDCSKVTYNENEKLSYHNDEPYSGKCNSYYMNGKLESTRSYLNGQDHGKWIYKYLNGNLEMTGEFEKGERIGEWEYFHTNGKLKQNSFYENGLNSGIWKMYDEKGALINEINYNKN